MLQVGEKVRYLDDVGEATIIKFVNAKIALVEDEYGLTHNHPIDQLVPATRDRVAEKKKPKVAVEKKKTAVDKPLVTQATRKLLPELALAFESSNKKNPESGDLDLMFVNNSNYHLLINIAAKENDEWFSLYSGEILPNKEQLIQSLRRQDVGTVSNLNVDLLFFRTTGYSNRKPISCAVKIKVTRFVKSGNYVLYEGLENPAIALPVETENVIAAPTIKSDNRSTTTKNKPSLPIFEEEVDLHLEKILGHEALGMNDHEKFLTQMRHFERKLNNALTHNYNQITFIHGVGTGRLKDAIRNELKEYGLSFEDGLFRKYGVGATVVQLN